MQYSFQDKSLPIEERIDNLISLLSLDEKIGMLMYESPALERLGIPAYGWWNEGLHGVGRAGKATVFPQAIGLAATFNISLAEKVADAISTEARAKFIATKALGNRNRYSGLSFWTPNINIFRDPRWGRGQETYGEDPFLTSEMGKAFVRGLQGDNPNGELKTSACAKHFAVHSGPEKERHSFNAKATKKDLWETYLPAFEALVSHNVETVMCAYNRTNDKVCCGSDELIHGILFNQWKFQGHIVSDCWALRDLHGGHKITETPADSAAYAINHGIHLNCGDTYVPHLKTAVEQGKVKEATVEKALRKVLATRFKLGLFNENESSKYDHIDASYLHCEDHQTLAYETALESFVLLKNKDNALPLLKNLKTIYITGPNATSVDSLLGNYYGISSSITTMLEGIVEKANPGTLIDYKPGCMLEQDNINPIDWATFDAQQTDAIVAVMGISPLIEGEEGESILSKHYGDRDSISMPQNQIQYLKKLRNGYNGKLIVAIMAGSPLALHEVADIADAIIYCWYPGEKGGSAFASILFGEASPCGKLPVTFPKSTGQLPDYYDYSMNNRTYRYMKEEPLYPFGFGLGYSAMMLSNLTIKLEETGEFHVNVQIENVGRFIQKEKLQLYITAQGEHNQPAFSLKGIQCIELDKGQKANVHFNLHKKSFALINDNGEPYYAKKYIVRIGTCLPTNQCVELGGNEFVQRELELK